MAISGARIHLGFFLIGCLLLVAPATSPASEAESADPWPSILRGTTVVEPIDGLSRELADLNPTLAGIDIDGKTAFEVPWHAVPLSRLESPVIPGDGTEDVDTTNLPLLNSPRMAMTPGRILPKDSTFEPEWRSPSTGSVSDAFDEAGELADAERDNNDQSQSTEEPSAIESAPAEDSDSTTSETTNAGPDNSQTPATEQPEDEPAPSDTPAAGLKPLDQEPELAEVPRTSDATEPVGSPEASTPATQSPSDSAEESSEGEERDAEPSRRETKPERKLKPLTRNQIYLRNKIRTVLSHYYRRPLTTNDHDSWEVMHAMLAYGLDSKVRQGGMRGEPITAIGWLCYNNPSQRTQLLDVNAEGELRAKYGVGVQGHLGQFLAMLAQCNVTRTYPIRVKENEFTIEDLIVSEQKTCYAGQELTFKLIGLMHYLPSNSTWLNERGEQWSIDRLIAEELKQPIRGAACGGTHRLSGLSLAVKRRESRGEPLDGEFARADAFTKKYEALCFRLQNPDGSLSTQWFKGPGDEDDIDRRVRTTGHQLEWLLYHVDDEQLDYWRVVRAVNYLTNAFYNGSSNEWDSGALCHGLHALVLYDERKFQPYDKEETPSIAARTRIPAASKPPTSEEYGPRRKDERNSGFRLFGGRR